MWPARRCANLPVNVQDGVPDGNPVHFLGGIEALPFNLLGNQMVKISRLMKALDLNGARRQTKGYY